MPKRVKIYSDVALRSQHRAGIGAVAAEWASLESFVVSAIATFARMDLSTGTILTNALPDSARPKVLETLCIAWPLPPVKLKALKDALGELEQLRARRNRIVHATWNLVVWGDGPHKFKLGPPPADVSGYAQRKSPTAQASPVTTSPQDMRTLAEEIFLMQEDLRAILFHP